MNLSIYSFRNSLREYINNYDLPSEVKRLVVGELYKEIEKSAIEETVKEAEEREKNEKD